MASGTLRLETNDVLQYLQQQRHRGSLLVIVGNPADIGTHLVVEEKVSIGRETKGLQLHDGGISRRHASVERREGTYVIRDLGSTNGTCINGVKLRGEHQLQEGDKIFLGQTVVVFRMLDETEASYLKQVEHLVGTDELTGLISKHRFDAALKEGIRTARANGLPLSAMMMDMDGLKAINDRHGHQAGASTIRNVGQLIGRLLDGYGKACRFGGDEFSAFLPQAEIEQARALAEQIRREVALLGPYKGECDLPISISIGVAALTSDIGDMLVLLTRADQALYQAKANGKNQVCLYK
jgi:diguanylate cyclase (GGDEF)-like protein